MTTQELFEGITKLTGEDKRKASQVFIHFDDYLIDHLPGYCEDGCEIDFGAYACEMLDALGELK